MDILQFATPVEDISEFATPVEEPDMSTFDTFDDKQKNKISDSAFYAAISGQEPNEIYDYVEQINEQVHGKPDGSQVNQSIVDEISNDLQIGTLGLGVGLLGTIKKRAMQLSGMGIFPDENIRHQFEVTKPDRLEPPRDPLEKMLYKRLKASPLPGARIAESFGVVSRLPDVGIKLLQEKSQKVQEELPPATLKTTPITRLVRPILQNVPQRIAAIGLGLITGDPITALALLGETEGGNNFVTNIDRGDSLTKATFFSELDEAAEIGGEMLILPKVFKGLDDGLTVRQIANIAIENAGQEGATGFMQEFLDVYGLERGKGASIKTAIKLATGKGLMAIPENAWVGGFMGGGEATAVSAVNSVSNLIQQARARAEVEQALGENAPPEAIIPEQQVTEEPPDVTEEEIVKALDLEPTEASTMPEQIKPSETSSEVIPQEEGQVTEETKPVENVPEENVNNLQGERDILGGEDPIQVLGQNLKKAKELVPVIQAEQKVARKERFQKMRDVANELINKQGLTPSQALNIARMQLSGEQTEYNRRFESIRKRLEQSSPGTVKALELTVWNSPELQLMDKNTLIVALNKLIDGHYLQKAEIRKIREFFGDALGDIAESRIKIVPWYEQISEIWRAGLLTGIKTSMLNEMSNFFHAVTETASDNVAAGIDAFVSKVTGNDRTIAATVKGEVSGFMKKGVPEFKHYMKTGVDNRNINKKYDYAERSYGNGKWAKFRQAYVNTIFHLMGAEDMLFYYAAEGRSYYNQALAQGINEGLSGKELTDYADKLAINPTEKMIEIGINDAETAVFMNKTVIGDLAAAIQNKLPVLGKVIVPFSRTPAAIGMQIINYTPVGTAKEVIQQIHQGKFDQRKFSQAVGRSIVGTAVLVIGAELLKAGLMTLGYPKGERERKLWEVEGRKPFSVKVGNKWRSIYVLGPAGNVLIIGGYFQQAYQETGSPTEAMTVALFGGAKSIAEQTFLRGLNQALTAVSEPEMSWNRWFSDMAGSAVPTIIADISRATDTTERRAEGPIQKIANRLPFTREMLQPKLDVFGQDLPRYGGNPFEVMVDPTRPAKINQDIVVDELRRLWDADIKVSPTLLGDRMGYDILTDAENTELWRNAGRYVYRGIFSLIMDSEYKILTNEDKGKAIENIVKDAKDLARAEMAARKISEGVTEIELRNGKLLTNDVKKLLGD